MPKILVSASLLSADPLNLKHDLKLIEEAGIDWHHVDVMDGHFVKNLTFGPPLLKAIKKVSTKALDVHLMISNPEETAFQYIEAGADYLTVHIEALKNPEAFLKNLKKKSIKVGLSLKPKTSAKVLEPFLHLLDLILVMSVEPGFGGQAFIEESYEKVKELSSMLQEQNLEKKVLISVDGGVNNENAPKLQKAGARCLVAGSFLYKAKNRSKAVLSLKKN